MRRSYKLQDLGCANCAAKMEDKISRLDGVNKASVNFMMSKLMIDADTDDMNALVDEAQKIITKIEPDCVIVR